jgi:CPA2 family monovalent cation:H+ antiporter-2
MAITPFIIPKADELVRKLLNYPISKPIKAFSDLIGQKPNIEDLSKSLDDHLIIIGFGINGRNVARAARHANIPYLILELNAETVKKEQENGEPILFGDAVDMHILEHTNVSKARVVVIAISDPEATKKIIVNTRSIAPAVFILVRTRFVKEIEPNLLLGADEVIPEEFETSIQIFVRVLRRYFVSQDDIYNLVEQIREDNYDFLRPNDQQLKGIKPSFFSSLNVAAIRVDHSSNDVVGKRIQESMIREKYGVNVVAIRKESKIEHDIRPETIIQNGDVLYVSGISENVRKFAERVCVTHRS